MKRSFRTISQSLDYFREDCWNVQTRSKFAQLTLLEAQDDLGGQDLRMRGRAIIRSRFFQPRVIALGRSRRFAC